VVCSWGGGSVCVAQWEAGTEVDGNVRGRGRRRVLAVLAADKLQSGMGWLSLWVGGFELSMHSRNGLSQCGCERSG